MTGSGQISTRDEHTIIDSLEEKVLGGGNIDVGEATGLSKISDSALFRLLAAAGNIRDLCAGRTVDLCSIVNAKSGGCSEDCRFCAQSSHSKANTEVYGILPADKIIERAFHMESLGVERFSIVTSGRGLGERNLERVLEIYERLRAETSLKLCASLGIIDRQAAVKLRQAGVSMYHHNLETAESYFSDICTTHKYSDRVATIRAAQEDGLEVCSGGIISMGETMEQRIEMAFSLKELGIKSIPINILNPIRGTALEGQQVIPPREILKTIAIFRFILPDARLRFAGGRENALRQLQALGYTAGINAAIVGNYLTTAGGDVEDEVQMIRDMGLKPNEQLLR